MIILVWIHLTMYVVAFEYIPCIEPDEPCYPVEERSDSETIAVESMSRWIGQR